MNLRVEMIKEDLQKEMIEITKELEELKAILKRLYEAIVLYLYSIVNDVIDKLCIK